MDSGVLGILAKFPVTVVETKDSGLPTRLPVLDILGDATGVGGNAVAMMGVDKIIVGPYAGSGKNIIKT